MASFTFFGIQIAYRRYRDDTSRGRLHHIIAGADEDQTLPDKRAFWKNVVALVKGNLPHFEYGYWDFIRGAKAEGEFETWTSEIEAGLATEVLSPTRSTAWGDPSATRGSWCSRSCSWSTVGRTPIRRSAIAATSPTPTSSSAPPSSVSSIRSRS